MKPIITFFIGLFFLIDLFAQVKRKYAESGGAVLYIWTKEKDCTSDIEGHRSLMYEIHNNNSYEINYAIDIPSVEVERIMYEPTQFIWDIPGHSLFVKPNSVYGGTGCMGGAWYGLDFSKIEQSKRASVRIYLDFEAKPVKTPVGQQEYVNYQPGCLPNHKEMAKQYESNSEVSLALDEYNKAMIEEPFNAELKSKKYNI